jgi:hypothetical protein
VAELLNKVEEVHQIDWQRYSRVDREQSGLDPQQVLGQDTLFVGATPHDTVRITGTYNHTGQIFVFNDGVLYIQNATVTNYGDVFVFGNGTLFADSSSLTFPQEYFYQRSLLVVQHGTASIQACHFNYSGLSHNLVISAARNK